MYVYDSSKWLQCVVDYDYKSFENICEWYFDSRWLKFQIFKKNKILKYFSFFIDPHETCFLWGCIWLVLLNRGFNKLSENV